MGPTLRIFIFTFIKFLHEQFLTVVHWNFICRYTLLLGKPPFETSCLKDTYTKIKKNEYYIPAGRTSPSAKNLIEQLLQSEPTQRPTMEKVLQHEFFTSGKVLILLAVLMWI